MTFTDQTKLLTVVRNLVKTDADRAFNRSRINAVFNGDSPYTDEEVAENGIATNVNFLEGTEVIHRARMQFYNAMLKNDRYFTVSVDFGPAYKRAEWGMIISQEIARVMKRSARYRHLIRSRFGGVVLHGIGPVTWHKDKDWCPKVHGVEDVLVPARTLQSLENLPYFAVRAVYTAAELAKFIQSGNSMWKADVLKRVLKSMTEKAGQAVSSSGMNTSDEPEAYLEDIKENGGYYDSDVAPHLKVFEVYYLDTEKDSPIWRRKIVVDSADCGNGIEGEPFKSDPVIFDSKAVDYGSEIGRILHVQFADGSVKPPFRWHSTRSLGYLLYSICHLQNRLRCRGYDATFESLMWLFRSSNAGDEERLRRVDLYDKGIIPQGLEWVSPSERPTVDWKLLEFSLSDNRSLISEKATTFTQDINDGTKKEMTATEARGRNAAASAIVGGMLNDAYAAEEEAHREIARRFAKIEHKDCLEFRQRCQLRGVPPEAFNEPEKVWSVRTERTMGNGNKVVELEQAQGLLGIKDTAEVSPQSRRFVVRRYISALTDDPALASEIVPEEEQTPSSAVQMASLAWGTLMAGMPVVISDPVNPIEYINTLIQFLTTTVQRIEAAGGSPDMEKVQGLANAVQHITQQIEPLQVVEALAEQVRAWQDALGQAANRIKAYVQRLQEAMAEQGGQMDPAEAAKLQAIIIGAQAKARIAEESAAQKRQHKEIAFHQDQERKNAATLAELKRKGVKTNADVAALDAKTRADIIRQNVMAANEPEENENPEK
jgi:hypothetical protein